MGEPAGELTLLLLLLVVVCFASVQYNSLNQLLPLPDALHLKLLRSAGIGFCAGVASDVVSNSVRVVKTTRQTARATMSYQDVVKVRLIGGMLINMIADGIFRYYCCCQSSPAIRALPD
jgi:hypothetical protein